MAMGLTWLGNAVRNRVVDEIGKRMEQGGAQAVSYARELVPKDTRQTEESIGYTWDRASLTLSIHADTSWAVFLELGTSRMAARPFLRPAMAEVGKFFGVASTQAELPNVPAKYQAGYAAQVAHSSGVRTIIGHRRRRR